MAKKKKKDFYAVAKGRKVGIYSNWPDCEAQVKGFGGAKYKSFYTKEEADEYIKQNNWDYELQQEQCTTPRQRQTRDDSIWRADFIGFEDDCARSSSAPFPVNEIEHLKVGHLVGSSSMSSSEGHKELERQARRAASVESSNVDQDGTAQRKLKRSATLAASADRSNKRAKPVIVRAEARSNTSIKTLVQPDSQVRTIQVYTDGACSDNGYLLPGRDGVSIGQRVKIRVVIFTDSTNLGRVPGDRNLQTNNRAELLGLIRAIQICPDDSAQLEIIIDSQYCINVVEVWQKIWRRNGWMRADNLPVSNKDLIRRLEREMRSRSLRPKLIWARGQSHGKGNNMADELANKGKNLPMVPPHLAPNFEPSDSEEECDEQDYEKTIQMWIKHGLSRERAEQRVGPISG